VSCAGTLSPAAVARNWAAVNDARTAVAAYEAAAAAPPSAVVVVAGDDTRPAARSTYSGLSLARSEAAAARTGGLHTLAVDARGCTLLVGDVAAAEEEAGYGLGSGEIGVLDIPVEDAAAGEDVAGEPLDAAVAANSVRNPDAGPSVLQTQAAAVVVVTADEQPLAEQVRFLVPTIPSGYVQEQATSRVPPTSLRNYVQTVYGRGQETGGAVGERHRS
jgi:hypothetical protein